MTALQPEQEQKIKQLSHMDDATYLGMHFIKVPYRPSYGLVSMPVTQWRADDTYFLVIFDYHPDWGYYPIGQIEIGVSAGFDRAKHEARELVTRFLGE